jgi:hypothetical protein
LVLETESDALYALEVGPVSQMVTCLKGGMVQQVNYDGVAEIAVREGMGVHYILDVIQKQYKLARTEKPGVQIMAQVLLEGQEVAFFDAAWNGQFGYCFCDTGKVKRAWWTVECTAELLNYLDRGTFLVPAF